MSLEKDTAIIVQARLGSTRLPGKMQRPFHGEKSLLEIVIAQLKKTKVSVIIATSTNPENDWIAQTAEQEGCLVFRGEENDVLKRFIDAAEHFGVHKIIRVCADNPFILPEYLDRLSDELATQEEQDYIAYAYQNGLPTIKSHIGLFGEGCTLAGLKKIKEETNEPLYREHVTNYFYAKQEGFNLRFLTLPSQLEDRKDVRLTIDTKEDFEVSSSLYKTLFDEGKLDNIDALLTTIDGDAMYLKTMKNEITRNSK